MDVVAFVGAAVPQFVHVASAWCKVPRLEIRVTEGNVAASGAVSKLLATAGVSSVDNAEPIGNFRRDLAGTFDDYAGAVEKLTGVSEGFKLVLVSCVVALAEAYVALPESVTKATLALVFGPPLFGLVLAVILLYLVPPLMERALKAGFEADESIGNVDNFLGDYDLMLRRRRLTGDSRRKLFVRATSFVMYRFYLPALSVALLVLYFQFSFVRLR
jgi:hypothetical protein